MNQLPISCWAAEDIPTNKVNELGTAALSDAELLSIIIGSGSQKETAVELARKILFDCDNNLSLLAKRTAKQLAQIYGVGQRKAAKIMAAIELGKRRQESNHLTNPELSTATRIYNEMIPVMQDLDHEEFWVLLLNQKYSLIRKFRLSIGGITEVSVDVRIMMREAVLSNATILIACHNHPSGSLCPSKVDNELTQSIKNACQVMRIHFLDHVIITDGAYYSYREQGRL